MMDENIRKFLEQQNALRRQLEPFSATMKAFENSGAQRLLKELNARDELLRAVNKPLEDMRRAGLLDVSGLVNSEYRRMTELAQARFRLPEINEAAKLFQELEVRSAATAIKALHERNAEITRAVEAMRTPWLAIHDTAKSFQAFVQLQGIGNALRSIPAFDTRLTDVLRLDLGDWRDKIEWPNEIFTDPVARTSFYTARGFDPALTNFPPLAFDQSLEIAGLRQPLPPPVEDYYGAPDIAEVDEGDAGLERTNAAHKRLVHFETHLREFIDEKMREAFGEDWIRQRVHPDLRDKWTDRRKKSIEGGSQEWPLIAYIDFTEYVSVITRKDVWAQVFEVVFTRQELVRESFQRLYPIRNCTMHSRPVTQDDRLYLYVETKRLLAAIGIEI
jgi:hypothetical protein